MTTLATKKEIVGEFPTFDAAIEAAEARFGQLQLNREYVILPVGDGMAWGLSPAGRPATKGKKSNAVAWISGPAFDIEGIRKAMCMVHADRMAAAQCIAPEVTKEREPEWSPAEDSWSAGFHAMR